MKTMLVATSNQGKLRDFAGAAARHGIEVAPLPGFNDIPAVVEDGKTFIENAAKKAVEYSRACPGQLVIADDSGLEVYALNGAPGVVSARYAAMSLHANSDDAANNAKLLRELERCGDREARFVCVIAAARDGELLGTFHGEAAGSILRAPRGTQGFGYDPLFLVPDCGKTFAEMSSEEKAQYSHRGAAFRKLLEWYRPR